MNDDTDNEFQKLTRIFRKYGADDPEAWARSQIEEGIPQLAIFSFAKALWDGIVSEDDDSWIDEEIDYSEQKPGGHLSQAGLALKEMLAKKVSRDSITDLVRVMQYSAMHHACALLDGARIANVPLNSWTLHQVDEEGYPVAIIQGLNENLLQFDPTGREMDPRTEGV